MIENECKIINDLLPNYVENLTSKETDKFIENHIKTCTKCKEKLEELNELEQDQEKAKKAEEKKQKKLKREKRLTLTLKIIIILFIIGLIGAWGYKLYNKIKVKNNREFLEQVCNKYQEIKEIGNYRVIVQHKDGKNNTYNNTDARDAWITCANGRMKEQIMTNEGTEVKYSAIIDNCKITLDIENYDQRYGGAFITSGFDEENLDIHKYNTADTELAILEYYKELEEKGLENIDIKKKEYQGKQYYVIDETLGRKDANYRHTEIWVEKETMLVERTIYEIIYEDGTEFGYEKRFNWYIGIVSEDEIKLTKEEKEEANKYVEEKQKEYVITGDPEKDQYVPRMQEKLKKAKVLIDHL